MNKQKYLKLRQLIAGVVTLVYTTASFAAVPGRLEFVPTYQTVDLEFFEELQRIAKSQQRYTPADFIPTNMTDSSDQGIVMSRIANQSLQTYLRSEAVRNSSLAIAAQAMNVEFHTSLSADSADPHAIKHDVSFVLKAANSEATIRYKGYVDTSVSYQLENGTTVAEVNRNLTGSTSLVYNYTSSSLETKNMMSVRWVF